MVELFWTCSIVFLKNYSFFETTIASKITRVPCVSSNLIQVKCCKIFEFCTENFVHVDRKFDPRYQQIEIFMKNRFVSFKKVSQSWFHGSKPLITLKITSQNYKGKRLFFNGRLKFQNLLLHGDLSKIDHKSCSNTFS